MTTDPRQLAQEALRRVESTTKGPWRLYSGGGYVSIGHERPCEVLDKHLGSMHPFWDQQAGRELGYGNVVHQWHHDYNFIAHARQDVPNLATALLAALDERERLLAPAEGVDVEEVLRLDREATPGPWRAVGASIRVALPGGIEYQWATASYPRDTALIVHYRTAAPALAREVTRLREALSTAEKERATIWAAVGLPPDDPAPNVIEQIRRQAVALRASRSAHETTVGVSLRLDALNVDLTARVEELRLTLAAERGDPAGAPSPGWEYGVIDEEGGRGWRKPTADGMLFAWGAGIDFLGADRTPDPHPGGWTRWVADEDGDLDEMPECVTDETWTARAAMIAADEATP